MNLKSLFQQASILSSIAILIGTVSPYPVFAANINCNGTADCIGTPGSDNIRGDRSSNNIFGDGPRGTGPTGAADNIFGGSGADAIFAQAGDDKVDAGAGDDVVHGGAGNDKIYGGTGNDVCLDGDDGTDKIDGGPGNDCINGEGANPGPTGADILIGSSGNDDISAFQHHSTLSDGKRDIIDCGSGFDSAWFNTSIDHDLVSSNCEDLHTS